MTTLHTPYASEKFERVKKKMGTRVYIVLTRRDIVNRYRRFEIQILKRDQIIDFVKQQFSGRNISKSQLNLL